jgi:hypothetical protein
MEFFLPQTGTGKPLMEANDKAREGRFAQDVGK